MKIIITRIVFLLFLILTIPGCYTVVWEPDMEFPNENNSEYTTDNYYDGGYYGDYNYFYNYPWWLSLNPPTKDRNSSDRDKNSPISTLRNTGDGRSPGDGRNPGGVINTPPPTRDGSNGNTTSNEGSSSGETVKTDTNRSNSSGNSSNPVRNNDGNRTTDGKKR
jgi:hypothetical protein